MTRKLSRCGDKSQANSSRPELVGMPDLIDNTVDPHNAFVVSVPSGPKQVRHCHTDYKQSDGVTSYIQWAHENDFGVIDANVPHYITRPEDVDPFMQRPGELTLSQQIKELMNYIWDNYVQLYDFEDLFLMGVGNAYLGVKLLLTERREYSFQRPRHFDPI